MSVKKTARKPKKKVKAKKKAKAKMDTVTLEVPKSPSPRISRGVYKQFLVESEDITDQIHQLEKNFRKIFDDEGDEAKSVLTQFSSSMHAMQIGTHLLASMSATDYDLVNFQVKSTGATQYFSDRQEKRERERISAKVS